VSICVRAGLPKPRPVPDTERIKDTKTLDYASTPLDANTLLAHVPDSVKHSTSTSQPFSSCRRTTLLVELNVSLKLDSARGNPIFRSVVGNVASIGVQGAATLDKSWVCVQACA